MDADSAVAVAAGGVAPPRQGENHHTTVTVTHEAAARHWQLLIDFVLMVCSPHRFQLVSSSA